MPPRHPGLAAREIALAPERPGIATFYGDATLHRPPERPRDWHPRDVPDAVHEWAAHVAAGRIGKPQPPASPEVIANREANDALFRAIAQDRHRARARFRR